MALLANGKQQNSEEDDPLVYPKLITKHMVNFMLSMRKTEIKVPHATKATRSYMGKLKT